MSATNVDAETRRLPADGLATGVAFLLALTVVQRIVGFGRSMLFCRYLDDHELGQWSLAFSFLVLGAPLVVLGLPGSFGRYVEHYRQKGQLQAFLWRTSLVSGGLALASAVAMFVFAEPLAWLVFGDGSRQDLMRMLVGTLLLVVVYNYLTELLTALRQVRLVSCMHFVSSFTFAVGGILLLTTTRYGASGVVAAYALSCVLAGLLVFSLKSYWSGGSSSTSFAKGELWTRLLPFAAWIWLENMLANLMDSADRYMLIHLAADTATQAQALVGQYHSSRVIPMLLVSVATMLGGVLLPYLTADWEQGSRQAVSRRLNLAMKLVAVTFSLGSCGILLLAPYVFETVMGGKYAHGLDVLSWTLTYCLWFSLATLAMNYLWCAEKSRLVTLAMLIALVCNIALNAFLVPTYGLSGAVFATLVANAVALIAVLLAGRRAGWEIDGGVWWCMALPLCIATEQLVLVPLIILLAWQGSWLFTAAEKAEINLTIRDRR